MRDISGLEDEEDEPEDCFMKMVSCCCWVSLDFGTLILNNEPFSIMLNTGRIYALICIPICS